RVHRRHDLRAGAPRVGGEALEDAGPHDGHSGQSVLAQREAARGGAGDDDLASLRAGDLRGNRGLRDRALAGPMKATRAGTRLGTRGAVYVEFLLAFMPLFVFFMSL